MFELSREVEQKIAFIIFWTKLKISFLFISIQMFLFLGMKNFLRISTLKVLALLM